MRKRVLMLSTALLLAGCGDGTGQGDGQAADGSAPVNIIFGTGGTSGAYYAIGGALKTVFERSDRIDNVQVVATGASVQNINNIRDGLNQMALVMSDVAFDAIHGQNAFSGNPVSLRAIGGLYPNVVQVVVTEESGIRSIADLRGRRVGVGKVGSGVEQSAKKVFEAAGMTYDDLARVNHTGYADSVTELSNGNLDAAFFTSGVPNSNVTGLMQNVDIRFIPIDGQVAGRLLDTYPYYQPHTIPAHAPERYDLEQPLTTVSIRNLLIVPASLADPVAEELARRFHDYLGSGGVSVSALTRFDRDSLDRNLVLPIHPGAVAFYDGLAERAAAGMTGAGDDAPAM